MCHWKFETKLGSRWAADLARLYSRNGRRAPSKEKEPGPSEVTQSDDAFDQYRKRMMLVRPCLPIVSSSLCSR